MRTMPNLPLRRASWPAAVISAAFMSGSSLKGQLSLGISTKVSRSSSKNPERLPFQKKVTCPNFWVSLQAKVCTPAFARYCPDTLSMAGGGTRNLAGSFRSPSYCIMPANSVLGKRTRSKASKSSYSKALLISTMRSARKLNSTTASPSSMVPTGLPSSSITKGGSHWSVTGLPSTPPFLSSVMAVRASGNLWGASPSTCAFHPFSTMLQSAS
mmetsp:Transcript_17667/g.53147  ORF Transcript_17667/g.53147 Transcript_17667/m.53147 type:complete len:213 (-) Transcript_17667:804-1442(-)